MAPRKTEAQKAATRRARNKRYTSKREAKSVASQTVAPKTPKTLKVSHEAVVLSMQKPSKTSVTAEDLFRPSFPAYPPGVAPRGAKANLAMDDAFSPAGNWAAGGSYPGLAFEGLTPFLGYPYLASQALRPEIRKIVEITATESTRRWIKVQSIGEDEGAEDKSEKIKQLTDALDKFKVRSVIRKAIEVDGYFGRAHILIDLGQNDSADETKTSIGNGRDPASEGKISKGSLKGFRVIEPMWVYPQGYNSADPSTPDFYKPQIWLVQGKPFHRTRLLTMVGREVPDIFKPAYQFGGLSITQIALPYVDNFVRTRQSVSDLVHSFSVSGVKTNLSTVLAGGSGSDLDGRAQIYNNYRDNRGLMLLDKDTEEFFNVSTPLGTLDHLLAQSQEQISSIASIPLVKYLGITPSGLNASSDGEVRCWYDNIHAGQENQVAPSLDVMFAVVQLSEFGKVDPDLTYKFEPLWTLDEKELAEVQKIKAETAAVHIDAGVISPQEERERVADDPDAPYSGLDDELPVMPMTGPEQDNSLEHERDPGEPD